MTQVEVHLWGSSHFCNRSTFPTRLSRQLQLLDTNFSVPNNHSRGGARIGDDTIETFMKVLESAQQKPQLHIVLLGDNNFRRAHSVEDETRALKDHLLLMADRLTFNENAHMIMLGLMPCIDRFDELWPSFQQMNQYVRSELLAYEPRLHFLETDFFLDDPEWQKHFFRDGVHLNQEGDQLLTEHVVATIRRLEHLF